MVRVIYITALEDYKFDIRKSNILPTKAEMEEFLEEKSSSSRICHIKNVQAAYPEIFDFFGDSFISHYPQSGQGRPRNAVIGKAMNRDIYGNGILIREFK